MELTSNKPLEGSIWSRWAPLTHSQPKQALQKPRQIGLCFQLQRKLHDFPSSQKVLKFCQESVFLICIILTIYNSSKQSWQLVVVGKFCSELQSVLCCSGAFYLQILEVMGILEKQFWQLLSHEVTVFSNYSR